MRVPLTGGAYTARSLIASAQRCCNLYPEPIPREQGEPAEFTYYPTPGLSLLSNNPYNAPGRGLYTGSDNNLYAVVGSYFFRIDGKWNWHQISALPNDMTTSLVSMKDNTEALIIVNGSMIGYQYAMPTSPTDTGVLSQINDPAFYGSTRVDFIDTFFLFNRPGTPQFYVSPSEYSASGSTPFDPLYFANKTGAPDYLTVAAVVNRNIWLIGRDTAEIWADAGSPDFPFQEIGGAFVQHGCIAPYSVAQADASLFWLGHDPQGSIIVLQTVADNVKRVSTYALEAEWYNYPTVDDAIGYTYQINGHTFYVITFPSGDRTWVYDMATELWHSWGVFDSNGVQHRHPGCCAAYAYGAHVVLDYRNGALYQIDADSETDLGQPIPRIRSFPHMTNDWRRTFYTRFTADMQVGTAPVDGRGQVSLRYSDTRGATWSNPIMATLGVTGQFNTSVNWWRLGTARDRVFEISWSSAVFTALQGAWVDIERGTS